MRGRALLRPILSSWSDPRKRNQLPDRFHAFLLGFRRVVGCGAVSAWRAVREGGLDKGQVDPRHLSFKKNMRFLSLKHFKLLPVSCPSLWVLENREQQDSLLFVFSFLFIYRPRFSCAEAGSTGA